MIKHSLIGLTLLILTTATPVDGREPPIGIPPADVHFEVTSAGVVIRWWQASSADQTVLTIQCSEQDQAIYEPGLPGDHRRVITLPVALHACLYLAEYDSARLLGQYGPYLFTENHVVLPFIAK